MKKLWEAFLGIFSVGTPQKSVEDLPFIPPKKIPQGQGLSKFDRGVILAERRAATRREEERRRSSSPNQQQIEQL